MEKYLKPLKHFGQNFLVDENIIKKIISTFKPKSDDEIIEIGPGQGALTKYLIDICENYKAIEIDTRAAERLSNEFTNINLINEDFLKIDLKKIIDKKARITGNIPYNITSPILFKLMENRSIIKDSFLMVQYEVAKRLNSKVGTKDYGILAVLLQNFAEIKLCFKVPPTVFVPQPRVDSAIISLKWREQEINYDENIFKKLVKSSFSKRRKTLKNSLKNSIFEKCDFSDIVDTKIRAERLSINDFIKMTEYYSKHYND